MFLRRMKSLVFGLTFSVAPNAEEVLRLLLSPVPGLARALVVALVLVPVLASALELQGLQECSAAFPPESVSGVGFRLECPRRYRLCPDLGRFVSDPGVSELAVGGF